MGETAPDEREEAINVSMHSANPQESTPSTQHLHPGTQTEKVDYYLYSIGGLLRRKGAETKIERLHLGEGNERKGWKVIPVAAKHSGGWSHAGNPVSYQFDTDNILIFGGWSHPFSMKGCARFIISDRVMVGLGEKMVKEDNFLCSIQPILMGKYLYIVGKEKGDLHFVDFGARDIKTAWGMVPRAKWDAGYTTRMTGKYEI